MLNTNKLNRSVYHHAKVAQLVEHDLAKVGVAGPNPVFRSKPILIIVEAHRGAPLQ
jgi:hypothetical protein